MIRAFTDTFVTHQDEASAALMKISVRKLTYDMILEESLKVIAKHSDEWKAPDPSRITKIDDGNYSGVLIFVIAEKGYAPSKYWHTRVQYGSCSGCDALISMEYDSEENRMEGIMLLALHMVQKLKPMQGDDNE